VNIENARRLLAAWRSGEYDQFRGHLYGAAPDGHLSYCALGVAGVLCGVRYPEDADDCYKIIAAWLGVNIDGCTLSRIALRNDQSKWTFAQIADWFEAEYGLAPVAIEEEVTA
jgi:hypothetical protein